MSRKLPENYVTFIQDDQIRVRHVTESIARSLESLGGYEQCLQDEIVWVLNYANDEALGKLLGQLRDLGVIFQGAPAGWPPADVFDELRERGFVQGEFQELFWYRRYGPDCWVVRMR